LQSAGNNLLIFLFKNQMMNQIKILAIALFITMVYSCSQNKGPNTYNDADEESKTEGNTNITNDSDTTRQDSTRYNK
jgi:hypothetical protein